MSLEPTEIATQLSTYYRAWAEGLDHDQTMAILDWMSPRHANINRLLRSRALNRGAEAEAELGDQVVREASEAGARLAEACSIEVVPFDLRAVRGIPRAGFAALLETLGSSDLRPGDIIVDAGFMATTLPRTVRPQQDGELGARYCSIFASLLVRRRPGCPRYSRSQIREILFAPRTVCRVVDVSRIGQDHVAVADVELQLKP